jgi:hypothetical protein
MTRPIKKPAGAKAKTGRPKKASIGKKNANPDPMGILTGQSTYSQEELERKQAEFESRSSGAVVIKDEWQGKIEEGNPFDEAAEEWKRLNPDKHFRFISPEHSKRRGTRGYIPVRDSDGNQVKVGKQVLSYISKDAHIQRKKIISDRTANMRAAAKESFQEQTAKLERDGGGLVNAVRGGKVAGINVGVSTTHGHNRI